MWRTSRSLLSVRRTPKVLQQVSPKGADAWGGKDELPPHIPELLLLFPFGWGGILQLWNIATLSVIAYVLG